MSKYNCKVYFDMFIKLFITNCKFQKKRLNSSFETISSHCIVAPLNIQIVLHTYLCEKENLEALGRYSDESATFSFIDFECIKCNFHIFIFDLKKKMKKSLALFSSA